MIISIPHLEWHVAHACNFTCDGCGHMSNHGHRGIISYKEIKKWYELWAHRLDPVDIAVLGGEPLLNKEIYEILYLTREMWDKPTLQNIEMTSNGFLLEKFPDLPKILQETNIELRISVHYNSGKYLDKLKNVKSLIDRWLQKYNFRVKYEDVNQHWRRFYKGFGHYMEPFEDNDPENSFEHCIANKDCFQLLNGKIYKCPMLAYLHMTNELYPLSDKWKHYLTYIPLDADSSDHEVQEFFNRKAESFCAMCPSSPQPIFQKGDPLLNKKFYELAVSR